MEIIFDNKAKEALKELINKSSENYIRIKVFYGCGRPAYEIYPSFKVENDLEINVDDISFVILKDDIRGCNKLEIKYDNEVYNNGFYIKDIG